MASTNDTSDPVLFIVGPTASGKTELAVSLAERFNGEIVNADSRQLYRRMDIGTAKPTAAERERAVHHLIDVAEPTEACGLAWFLDAAHLAVAEIRRLGRLPIICGGTGQFIRALLEAWQVPRVPPDPALRAAMECRLAEAGLPSLVEELRRVDPVAAGRIDIANPRRVMRALEVATSRHHDPSPPAHREDLRHRLVIGIAVDRAALYERIDARVDAMFAVGFVDEVRALLDAGARCESVAFSAIGYREVCDFLNGTRTLNEVVERSKLATHRLARTQAGWFRGDDPRITWLASGVALTSEAIERVALFLDSSDRRG